MHLCFLAADFTTAGQPSLEALLTNVTRKPLPQQREERRHTVTKAMFKENLFPETLTGRLQVFSTEKQLSR